jgi:hypothetical protein
VSAFDGATGVIDPLERMDHSLRLLFAVAVAGLLLGTACSVLFPKQTPRVWPDAGAQGPDAAGGMDEDDETY